MRYNAAGKLVDSRDVIVATTNASLFGYVADGIGGLKVLQLTSPESQPKFYGFSPEPRPELIATYQTGKPAIALSKGLDRDRGVDETGGQIAVFGRRGSRPLNLDEMQRMYLDQDGKPWTVTDSAAPDDAQSSVMRCRSFCSHLFSDARSGRRCASRRGKLRGRCLPWQARAAAR
jgi:hypothetical protein